MSRYHVFDSNEVSREDFRRSVQLSIQEDEHMEQIEALEKELDYVKDKLEQQ